MSQVKHPWMHNMPWAVTGCVVTAIVSFNGFLWQLSRRQWKASMIQAHGNLTLPPKEELPTVGSPFEEFRRLKLQGVLDNDGTILVGPRPFPLVKGRTGSSDEARGGFTALTPFEVAETRQIVFINRGWVPIDAIKSHMHLTKYIGDGFKPITLTGIIRREEYVSSWYNFDPVENHRPIQGEISWFVSRPYDAALQYFRRRWGAENVEQRKEIHGARHYFLEELEDHTGNDQVLIKKTAFPVRRVADDITNVAITPVVHGMYAAFWLFVSCGALYTARRTYIYRRRENLMTLARQYRDPAAVKAKQVESEEYYKSLLKAAEDHVSPASVTSTARPVTPMPPTPNPAAAAPASTK